MNQNLYELFGLNEGATLEEVTEAYERLKKQYSEARFQAGSAGAEAAAKLNEIEIAYEDIKVDLKNRQARAGGTEMFAQIEQLIKVGNLDEAQHLLDEIMDRPAEWHYLQSIVFYRKNWYTDSKKQLELACKLDPQNVKYRDTLLRLNNMINTSNPNAQNQGQGARQAPTRQPMDDRQMGGCGTEMNCCANLICLDCCCESMGGDLIPCC